MGCNCTDKGKGMEKYTDDHKGVMVELKGLRRFLRFIANAIIFVSALALGMVMIPFIIVIVLFRAVFMGANSVINTGRLTGMLAKLINS